MSSPRSRVAVDAPGVRSVLATCEAAKKKNLSIVSGLCLRYDTASARRCSASTTARSATSSRCRPTTTAAAVWAKPREPDWTDMEYQMRNWYYFTWLSGDFNVEQHVHFLDVCAWVMKNQYPVRAIGMGGRQVRTGPEFGHIYDHFSIVYEYANGAKLLQPTAASNRSCNERHERLRARHEGPRPARREATAGMWIKGRQGLDATTGRPTDMYQAEHDELFASIRTGKPINNGEYMAKSTLLAIMGRMAAYTGQQITWEMALNSKEDLSPPTV